MELGLESCCEDGTEEADETAERALRSSFSLSFSCIDDEGTTNEPRRRRDETSAAADASPFKMDF